MKPCLTKIITNVPVVRRCLAKQMYPLGRVVICGPIILFALLSIPAAYSSVVAVVYNGHTYWVGTDAMESNGSGTEHYHICKVFNDGSLYWVATATPFSDPATGFSLVDLMKKAEAGNKSIKDISLAFASLSKAPLATELASIHKRNPAAYSTFMSSKPSHLIKIILFQAENNVPVVGYAIMTAKETSGKIVVDGDAGPLTGGMATGDAALHFLQENRQRTATDPVGLLRDSIVAEEKADPRHKAGRIAILEVTGSGVKWVDKGECK